MPGLQSIPVIRTIASSTHRAKAEALDGLMAVAEAADGPSSRTVNSLLEASGQSVTPGGGGGEV
ncbi:MAG: hypothetical protein J4F47_03685 [Alphaproteobacteria bacterium]|nr:hypothetical protein [Alphaproteobacteria bacterium]